MKSSEMMVWTIAVLAIVLVLVVNLIPASVYGDCQHDLRAVCER
jgi:L-asparagine transporter-like permease